MKKKIVIAMVSMVLIWSVIILVYGHYHKDKNETTTNTIEERMLDNNKESKDETTVNTKKNIEAENNVGQANKENTQKETIVSEVSPSGFMGSSLYKVILYSNGEVYVEIFDGNGYEVQNIVSKELIAKNAASVKVAEDEENYGMVFIKAEEIIKDNIGWIEFE